MTDQNAVGCHGAFLRDRSTRILAAISSTSRLFCSGMVPLSKTGGDVEHSRNELRGFWDMKDAGNMLDRIVKLWRPPTCQLASMELDMKATWYDFQMCSAFFGISCLYIVSFFGVPQKKIIRK